MSDYQRIYVAGPYSAPTPDQTKWNVAVATVMAAECMKRGHDAYCPHAASHPIEMHTPFHYERWMRLDFGLLRHWATAILYFAPSAGADRELALAEELGLRVYRSVEEVEWVE